MEVTDKEFDELIQQAMTELPQDYVGNLDNVAITYADAPSEAQLVANNVGKHQLLLGLYEGIPQTSRFSSSYSGVLPDRITLFKYSILAVAPTKAEFYEQIKRTLWHEIAHHYGLGHDHIHVLERNSNDDNN